MPRRKDSTMVCAVCSVVVVCLVLSLLGLIGLCLAIWQTVDALHTNHDLMKVAMISLGDYSLLKAFYIFIAFTCISMCCGGMGKRTSKSGDDDSSSFSVFCGVFTTLLLISGYLASGIIAQRYKSKMLPGLRWGMERALNFTYMQKGAHGNLEYTEFGQRFNYLQATKMCCGVSKANGHDFITADFPSRYNITVPYSCCVLRHDKEVDKRSPFLDDVENYAQCLKHNPDFFFQDVCLHHEHDWVIFKCNFLIGYNFTLVGFSTLLVLLLFLMCCLRR